MSKNTQLGNLVNGIYVDSTGKVGVGTTTPRAKFDVAGTIYSNDIWIADNYSLLFGNLTTGTSYAYISGIGATGASSYLSFSTNAGEKMRIDNNGKVGIGTESPTVALDVVGAGIFSGSVTATSISSVFKEGYIVKATTTGGGGSQPAYTYYTAAGSKRWATFLNVGDDKYHISNASNTELFTIQQNGNVGIGTTSPTGKFSVNTGASNQIALFNNSSSGSTYNIISLNGSYSEGTNMGIEGGDSGDANLYVNGGYASSTNGGIIFRSGGASTYTERMRIASDGNVAIGGTTALNGGSLGKWLTVNGSSYSGGVIFSISGTASTYLYTDVDSLFTVQAAASTGIKFLTNNAERMRITSGGNVIVGSTTDVSRPFSVWGSGGIGIYSGNAYSAQLVLNFNSSTNVGYLLSDQNAFYVRTGVSKPIYVQANEANGVYLSVGATSWTANSDERIKDINSQITDAVTMIESLRAVKFSWKSDESKKINIGLIAQDVKAVLPEIVDEQNDEIGTLGVRYVELVPVLVKAIQELSAEINILKQK